MNQDPYKDYEEAQDDSFTLKKLVDLQSQINQANINSQYGNITISGATWVNGSAQGGLIGAADGGGGGIGIGRLVMQKEKESHNDGICQESYDKGYEDGLKAAKKS